MGRKTCVSALILGIAFAMNLTAFAQEGSDGKPASSEEDSDAKGRSSEGKDRARSSMRGQALGRMNSDKYADLHGRPGNGPAPGEWAPDFALKPLKFYEFGLETEDITEDNSDTLYKPVRLSDFRGKKPVVLIFGSYT